MIIQLAMNDLYKISQIIMQSFQHNMVTFALHLMAKVVIFYPGSCICRLFVHIYVVDLYFECLWQTHVFCYEVFIACRVVLLSVYSVCSLLSHCGTSVLWESSLP